VTGCAGWGGVGEGLVVVMEGIGKEKCCGVGAGGLFVYGK
jgi:hypothetical protein